MEYISSRVKLVVVGDSGVGKTCLLTPYNTGSFCENVPPRFTQCVSDIMVDGQEGSIGFWDALGEVR